MHTKHRKRHTMARRSNAKTPAGADEKIIFLMAEVEAKKKAIKNADRTSWRTNCMFPNNQISTPAATAVTNINVVNCVKQLLLMATHLRLHHDAYTATVDAAPALLGTEIDSPPPFTWGGYTFEDWMHDIGHRISKLQAAANRKKLAELESRLEAIVSPELRATMELERITAELGK